MQAVPDEVRKCVVFISYVKDGAEKLAGTAFFMSVPIQGTDRVGVYLITARHVIAKIMLHSSDQIVTIRINSSGTSVNAHSDASNWKFHPTDSSVDVAILNWAPESEKFDYLRLDSSVIVTDKTIEDEQIGAGDEIFMTGLFSSHSGKTKNLPIIRTGNIAMMPEEKISTKDFGDIEAYLIEARSIGGLSGSPVFVYLGHTRSKHGQLDLGGQKVLFALLGVMHGHWDIDEKHIDSVDNINKNVNMGIGIVVPAGKIMEIIDTEESFIEMRKEVSQTHNEKLQNSVSESDIA